MSFERWIIDVMSGQARGVGAATTRAVMSLAEPVYAGAAAYRNRRFDHAREVKRLPRPVISVGNITTGGTGKTPAVQWLVRRLQEQGHRPGVLLRGYAKTASQASSDEESLLRESLAVPVVADADRYRGGSTMLAANPEVSVFVLDDGFQHRRLARDMDIVLIDATNPFGFGHVLPRGLLREPLTGLRRADLLWITRADQVDDGRLAEITSIIRTRNSTAPLAHAAHRPAAFLCGDERLSVPALAGAKVFAVSGIGNPAAFERSLTDAKLNVTGHAAFPDHHHFNPHDLRLAIMQARALAARYIVTTEKDWVKLATLAEVKSSPVPFVRLAIELSLDARDAAAAMSLVLSKLEPK